MRALLFNVAKREAGFSKLKSFVPEFRIASDAAEALFFRASSTLAALSAHLNSSFLCSQHHRGIRAFSNESSLCFLSKSPSAWLFLLLTPSVSSLLLLSLPHIVFCVLPPSQPSLPPSLLIPLHSASFEEVRLLSAWRNKSDLWMGQPTWVLEGEASGSQALWSSSPLFPPASLQGKLLCLSRLWSFTVPYRRHMLPLSDSQTAWIPTHCRGVCVCVQDHFLRGLTQTHPQWTAYTLLPLNLCAPVILLRLAWYSLLSL